VPYATASDVLQLNTNRSAFTGSSNPSLSDVNRYLELTAAELDGILRARGFSVPVPSTAQTAFPLMAHGNALGAAMLVEQGAPISDRRQEARLLYRDFKQMLQSTDIGLDAGLEDPDRGLPRSGFSASAVFAWPGRDSLGNTVVDV
jgi:hypothetical protein